MTPHETSTPGTPRATAPPARTFGPQGPTLGDLSDAYLQDTIRSGSAAPGAPPTAGPPIAPAGLDRCASGFAVVPPVPDTIVSHVQA